MKRTRRIPDTEMDITPMIDCTFLLLIFFLVASRMEEGVSLTLPEARNGTAITTKNSAVLSFKSTGPDTATVYRGEVLTDAHRIKSTDLAEQEAEIVAYVEQEFSAGKEQVLLRAEKSVKYRDVNRVMTAIGNIAGASVYVAVLEQR